MNETFCNKFILLDEGGLKEFVLDGKEKWAIGRPTENNFPDIPIHSRTVSRHQGAFEENGGLWFYTDLNSLNGTYLNQKRLKPGFEGRRSPKVLEDGNTFIFGAGKEYAMTADSVYGVYLTRDYLDDWRIFDISSNQDFFVQDGTNQIYLNKLKQYDFYRSDYGLIIKAGSLAYLKGPVELMV